jgi:hypothetical protein
MIDFQKILAFYKNPIRTADFLIHEKDLKWIYPILIYIVTFGFAFISVILVKLINNKIDVLSTFFYVPLLTLPFIFIITVIGTLFYKEFVNNFKSHLYSATLLVSYDFIIVLLLVICAIGLDYVGFHISPIVVFAIFILVISISRLLFNLRIYTSPKKSIWIKSIIEILLIFILSITIIGGLVTIINVP